MIGTRLGEYEIVSRLGAGAMGTVYLGRADDGGRVALKVLHPHLVEERGFFRRFEREAALGLAVTHDNVVRVLDYEMFAVEEKPTCVLVMEYVQGRTLRQLMADLDRSRHHISNQLNVRFRWIENGSVMHRWP